MFASLITVPQMFLKVNYRYIDIHSLGFSEKFSENMTFSHITSKKLSHLTKPTVIP